MSTRSIPGAVVPFPGTRVSAQQADDPVFDHLAALARVDGDESFLHELAELFLQEGPEQLASLATALAVEELAEVERLAHNLKGAACHFVASPTVGAAQRLETASARGDLVQARSAYRELTCELERLLGQLRALLCSPVDTEGMLCIHFPSS